MLFTGEALYSQITFNKSYDTNGSLFDWGKSIRITDSNEYIVAGGTWVSLEERNWYSMVLRKFDFEGNIIWEKIYTKVGFDYNSGLATSLNKTLDGGYAIGATIGKRDTVLGGYSEVDMLLVKFNSGGDTVWTKTYGGDEVEEAYVTRQVSDGSFYLIGYTESLGAGDKDYYIVKTDIEGNLLWDTTYGGPEMDVGLTLEVIENGGLLLGGGGASFGADSMDAQIHKLDSSGNIELFKTYGSPSWDCGSYVLPSINSSYIMKACLDTVITVDDWEVPEYVSRLDVNGEIIWKTFFNHPRLIDIWNTKEDGEGNIVVVGMKMSTTTGSPLGFIAKLDSNGNKLWERTHFMHEDKSNYMTDFEFTPDGGFIITGTTHGPAPNYSQDMWLIKLDSLGLLHSEDTTTAITTIPDEDEAIAIYPNPFKSAATVRIRLPNEFPFQPGKHLQFELIDLQGRLVSKYGNMPLHSPNESISFQSHRGNLPAGVYLFAARYGDVLVGKGRVVVN
jgi:hypothetical protein